MTGLSPEVFIQTLNLTDMRITKILVMLFSLTLACCTEREPIEFEPYPYVPGGATGTKFTIEGATFSEGHTFGLYVCKHEDQANNPGSLQFEEHNKGYNNVKVVKTATSWSFYNPVLKENLSQLYISTNDELVNADVYAYAPYVEDAVSPVEIPFNINLNRDLMYVTQNADHDINKNMPPSSVESDLALNFHHVLTKLEFCLKIKNTMNSVSSHTVDSIVIRRAGAKTTPLYCTGTFNAITGDLTPATTADSISVKSFFSDVNGGSRNGAFNSTTPKSFNVMIYPVDFVADGDLEVVLVIDGFRKTFAITRENVKHSDGTTYGFKAANEYKFNITIDNYVHLDGVTVKSDWPTDSYDDEI